MTTLTAQDHLVLVALSRDAQIAEEARLVRPNTTDLAVMYLGLVVLLLAERAVLVLRTLGQVRLVRVLRNPEVHEIQTKRFLNFLFFGEENWS